jgi:hypothetical protein
VVVMARVLASLSDPEKPWSSVYGTLEPHRRRVSVQQRLKEPPRNTEMTKKARRTLGPDARSRNGLAS